MNQDFLDLLRLLKEENAEYLIVGGYAVGKYTVVRATKDLDIWINTEASNSERVYTALKKFGAPLDNLSPKDFSEPGFFYKMGREPFRIDILMDLEGVDFNQSWERKEVANIKGTECYFISPSDLLINKEKVGRDIDLIDAKKLKEKYKL